MHRFLSVPGTPLPADPAAGPLALAPTDLDLAKRDDCGPLSAPRLLIIAGPGRYPVPAPGWLTVDSGPMCP